MEVIQVGGNARRREAGKNLLHKVAVLQIVVDVCFSQFFEGWYIVLKLMSQRIPNTCEVDHLVRESVNRLC